MTHALKRNSRVLARLATEGLPGPSYVNSLFDMNCKSCLKHQRWLSHLTRAIVLSTAQSGCCLPSVCRLPVQNGGSPIRSRWKMSQQSSSSFFENKHGFQKTQLRTVFAATSPQTQQALKRAANASHNDADTQARYLQSILDEDPHDVIERFESGRYAINDECRRIYLKAVQRVVHGGGGRGQAGELGKFSESTEQNPLYVKILKSKSGNFSSTTLFWKIVKYIIYGWMILAIIPILMESRNKITGVKQYKPEMETNQVKFADVQGAVEAKEELQDIVAFLKDPRKFQRLGAKVPAGILLTGKPGVGKTLLAKAVAGEAGVPFFHSSGSEFEEVYVGVGAARIRELFAEAKKVSPAIIFIDELDAVGGRRVRNKLSSYTRNTLNQLLVELDGFDSDSKVVVIAATNFPQSLDPALTRPGRFDSTIEILLPVLKEREAIFQIYLDKVTVGKEVDAHILAKTTVGLTGADIANMVNQAAIKAVVDGDKEILMKHFDYALDKKMFGGEKRSVTMSEEEKWKIAVHEGGHALVCLKGSLPLYKATVLPKGATLGHVQHLPKQDEFIPPTKSELLARMDMGMGGIVAEEIYFGKDKVTTGSTSDMESCKKIAKILVLKCGLGENMPLGDWEGYTLSQATKKRADAEINRMLQEAHDRAEAIINEFKSEHMRIAEGLLKYETLTESELLLVAQGEPISQDNR